MLRKGQMISFKRPMSSMKTVLEAVENGMRQTRDIVEGTKLRQGQVKSALHNLSFIGAIKAERDTSGRCVYVLPGEYRAPVARCLLGVRSIFDVR
jgi:predicted transcriptional regulator